MELQITDEFEDSDRDETILKEDIQLITDKAIEIMGNWNLCNRCLGRKFSKIIEAPDNKYRGKLIRNILNRENDDFKHGNSCYICDNIFEKIENSFLEDIIKKIEKSGIEFSTFLVGCRIAPEILQKEEKIQETLNLDIENIKKEINREIGKTISSKFNKEVDFDNPNIVIMADFTKNNISVQINPLFIEGRYKKLVRNIPQTKWPCRKCRGKGCQNCNYTGKMYLESVEELISPSAVESTNGTGSKFHGAGREDIDVKMLGSGRPFVLEIKEPKIRNINLENLETMINKYAEGKVEVLNLKFTDKQRRGAIKCSSTETYKTYCATVELEKDIDPHDLKLFDSLKVINQRTPIRVSHRRADKIRIRKIRSIHAKNVDSKIIEMIIECEGGLYIKELISGDQDRTKPSVSEVLKQSARCVRLDVLNVNI